MSEYCTKKKEAGHRPRKKKRIDIISATIIPVQVCKLREKVGCADRKISPLPGIEPGSPA
jgi:hypothetical protein